MKVFKSVLKFFGLMTISQHKQEIAGYQWFSEELGYAARAAGVNVLMDYEEFNGKAFTQDVYMLGRYTSVNDCLLKNSKVVVSPNAPPCRVIFNTFEFSSGEAGK